MWINDQDSANAAYSHISTWEVSSGTNMAFMFQLASAFNKEISAWDVSSVTITNMYGMFNAASAFNKEISAWDVSRAVLPTWNTCSRVRLHLTKNFALGILIWSALPVSNAGEK
jgi:hypothetical protein